MPSGSTSATAHRRRAGSVAALHAPRAPPRPATRTGRCRRARAAPCSRAAPRPCDAGAARSSFPASRTSAPDTTRNVSGSSTSAQATVAPSDADQRPARRARPRARPPVRDRVRWTGELLIATPTGGPAAAPSRAPRCRRRARPGVSAVACSWSNGRSPGAGSLPAAAGTRSCCCGRSPPGRRG